MSWSLQSWSNGRVGLVRGVVCLLAIVAVVGCGQSRRYGDEDGRPVAFAVHLERAFVNDMHRRPRVGVGIGSTWSSGGGRSSGVGVGFGMTSTEVYLLAYDERAKALVFRQRLRWGDNRFTVPLRPQRRLELVIEARGGRQGSEAVGVVAVDTTDPVVVTLSAAGSSLLDEPPDEAPDGTGD